jgi:Protein of unknown function (DUF3738)
MEGNPSGARSRRMSSRSWRGRRLQVRPPRSRSMSRDFSRGRSSIYAIANQSRSGSSIHVMRQSVALLSIVAVGVCASGQTAGTRAAFDVTSVKPAGGAQFIAFRSDPGGVHLVGPLGFFIRYAYATQDYQLEGGPGWIQTENYVVEGKAAASHTPQEMRSMVQALLEDRFALKMHRETKNGPIYSLVVARKGSKMKPSLEGSCVNPAPGKPPEPGTTACGYRPGLARSSQKVYRSRSWRIFFHRLWAVRLPTKPG